MAPIAWLFDCAGAIFVAAGLAHSVTALSVEGVRPLPALAPAAAMLIAGAVLRAIAICIAQTFGSWAAADEKARWRGRVLPALLRRGGSAPRMLGEEVADATDRIEDLDGYHARFQPLRVASVLAPLAIAAAVGLASPVSAAILLATLVPFAAGMALAGSMGGKAAQRQMAALGRQSGLFADRLRNLPMIRAFGAQDRVARQLEQATRDVAERTLSVLRVAFLSGAVLEFFAALSVALVAVYCGFHLLGLLPFPVPERLTLSEALFALALAPEFYLPMRRLAAAYHDKQLGEAARERLFALAGTTTTPAPIVLDRPPAIRAEGLCVDYDGVRVGPFDIDCPAGCITAIEGATGTGKSTVLHALLGTVSVSAGRIAIDGHPLENRGLRGSVSWVGQAVSILSGTLAENIRLARPGASDEAVLDAARRAGLTAVMEAREGLATWLDVEGAGLSGGERRRIGIARALLRDAPLWLLDEPTADLDAATAEVVLHALRSAMAGRTVLLVTHDPLLAATADNRIALP
ncbi:MAG: thiol reductant ABC exporter subunit CydD [Sphingobium sp.]|uniref:thiol reductant ABC exporter subunit CydD n=2 Tax=unclassified Sphingobium TaxID=2611147 RepID=UPI003BAFEEA1